MMKQTGKRKKAIKALIVIIIIAAVAWGAYSLFYSGIWTFKAHNNVDISGETLSKPIYSDGDLIKIGDKLYYNYEPTDSFDDALTYGLYEISSNGATRVYWGGFYLPPETNLFKMEAINNNIVKRYSAGEYGNRKYGEIYKYNTFTHNDEPVNKLGEEVPELFDSFKYIDDTYFYFSQYALYMQNGDKLEKVFDVSSNDENCAELPEKYYFESSDKFYFIKPDNGKSILCSYIISEKEEKELIKLALSPELICKVAVAGDKAVIGTGFDLDNADSVPALYMVDLNGKESMVKIFDDYISDIVYNGTVYACRPSYYGEEKGIYAVDLNDPSKQKRIYNADASSIYILDDEWIYFTGDNESLHRINLDGGKTETVFG